jgi:glycosyltransferase involved in cell wall biosynthesis
MQYSPDQSIRFRPVVVAPTFDNAHTLAEVLAGIERLSLPIIAVNDGSRDRTAGILGQHAGVCVMEHDRNRGKAAALATGFAEATRRGFTHALTIDTDAQHDPAEIPQLLDAAQRHPHAIVLGCRDVRSADYPMPSRMGRAISTFLVRLESGARVTDSQCGLRVYPLDLLGKLQCRATRYGFETEVLTRAAWACAPFVEVPIKCIYLPKETRVSHFRPIWDSLRAVGMHSRLLAKATLRWLSPIRAWREIRSEVSARADFAAGLAVGVFIACLPAYGLQSVLSLFAAKRLNLNPLSVLAGSQLSVPPLAPFLILTSLGLGHLLLHGGLPHIDGWAAARASVLSPANLRGWLFDWIIGGIVLGAALAAMSYAFFRAMFGLLAPRREC